jgi:hypothetical protein
VENVQQDTVTTEVGPWAMIPVWVLGIGLTGAELAVYVALRSYADRGGSAHPRVKSVAERAGVTTRTAERAISRMREMDIVMTAQWHRDDGSIGGCHYRLRDIPPTVVSAPTDTAVGTPPDTAVGTLPTQPSEPSRRSRRSKNTPENTPETTPTTSDRPTLADKAADLADVVVGGCGPIGRSITRKTLVDECTTLAGLGWTTPDIRQAVLGRTWSGCHAGAVITWLRGLSSPPARGLSSSVTGLAHPCPLHPEEPAGRCTQCDCEAVHAPTNWRDLITQ